MSRAKRRHGHYWRRSMRGSAMTRRLTRRIGDRSRFIGNGRLRSMRSVQHRKRLPFQRNLDDQPSHDVVHREVLLLAGGMAVVTAHTGLTDGAIGVDGLKISPVSPLYRSGHRTLGMFAENS